MKRSCFALLLLVPLALGVPLAYFASKRPRVLSSREADAFTVVGTTRAVLRPTEQPTTGFWKGNKSEGYQAVAFAPNGALLAARGVSFYYPNGGASGGCRLEVWNTASGKAKVFSPLRLANGANDLGSPIRELTVSPNGARWLGGNGFGSTLELLDTGSRKVAHFGAPTPPDKGGFSGILPMGFSGDGSRALVLTWTAPRKLQTALDAKAAAHVPIAGAIVTMRASDGKVLARRYINLTGNWPQRGRLMANGIIAVVTKLGYPNGGFGGGRLQLFDLRTGARRLSIERNMDSDMNGLAVSGDGLRVAFNARRASGDFAYIVQTYDLRTRQTRTVAKGAGALAFASDGRLAFESESGLNVVNLQTGAVRRVGRDARTRDFAFSPRGDLLASVSGDNSIKLWPLR